MSERKSKKGNVKWRKASHNIRLNYLTSVVLGKRFRTKLRYKIVRNTRRYDEHTIVSISDALQWQDIDDSFTTTIYIDGLAKTKRHTYGARLRRLGIPVRKVQGVPKDENNALIRLADAICGFVRDIEDGQSGKIRELFDNAKENGKGRYPVN